MSQRQGNKQSALIYSKIKEATLVQVLTRFSLQSYCGYLLTWYRIFIWHEPGCWVISDQFCHIEGDSNSGKLLTLFKYLEILPPSSSRKRCFLLETYIVFLQEGASVAYQFIDLVISLYALNLKMNYLIEYVLHVADFYSTSLGTFW